MRSNAVRVPRRAPGVASAEQAALATLAAAYRPGQQRHRIEDSPYPTVFVDITHRCNMECANCYIPNRSLPDFPLPVMLALLRRLPRRTRIRLVGAEPTVREDLPEIIRAVRAIGHLPVILSNGLKLARPAYVARLKAAGLRTVHLSLNGGLRDELYLQMDGLACARRKLAALDTLAAARMNVTVGMILAPDCNVDHLPEFLAFLAQRREVRDIHLRSVGPIGRHMEGPALDMDGLHALFQAAARPLGEVVPLTQQLSSRDFHLGQQRVQLTVWPELGSHERGRLTPDGFIEPMFESAIENAYGY
jgi:molybdenum cofactor biosynthesis enzyme MoaA